MTTTGPHLTSSGSATPSELEQLCINTIRTLAMDAVQAANSGHPGTPMALAPIAYLLYAEVMAHNPADPAWPDRDRFVLSAGHASMLLYSALHLSGYAVSLDDLRAFRQWGSITPGHPERGLTPGVETTTGPLGQGFSNGVGMAIAERFLREHYGAAVVDHRVFSICSDGDLMEGVASEAASIAGQLRLGRLVYLYDDNGITIDGSTALAFDREDVRGRFRAYGWHVSEVEDANDLGALRSALHGAIAEDERPSLIVVRSVIGYPSPAKQGTAAAHGSPLGADEVRVTKEVLGWDPDLSFYVPDEVYAAFDQRARGAAAQAVWEGRFAAFRERLPSAALEWDAAWAGRPLPGLEAALPSFAGDAGSSMATRAASGKVFTSFGPFVPTMVGGSADLTDNIKTGFHDALPFSAEHPGGRDIHFGVREHGMGSVVNGLACHGGIVRPYGSTFLQFADYMRPAIRLSALSELPVAWVYSHDSVGLGEDGPTHQPVEHIAALRAIPGLTVIRPGDPAEVSVAWKVILEELAGPVVLLLTRQGVPVLDRSGGDGSAGGLAPADGLAMGAYVLADGSDAVVAASGSEVSVALAARELLGSSGVSIRVVSMPSWELFGAQDPEYRASVFPAGMPSVSVEAGVAQGWERWVDRSVSIERFGASAPGGEVMKRLGITAEAVVEAVRSLL